MKTKVFFLTIVFSLSLFSFISYSTVEDRIDPNGVMQSDSDEKTPITDNGDIVLTVDDIKSFKFRDDDFDISLNAIIGVIEFNNLIPEDLWDFSHGPYSLVYIFLSDTLLFNPPIKIYRNSSMIADDLKIFIMYNSKFHKYQFYLTEAYQYWLHLPADEREQKRKENEENSIMRGKQLEVFFKYLSDNNKIITSISEVKTDSPIQIYSSGKTIHINNKTCKNGVVTIYRIDGVKVAEQTVISQTTTLEIPVNGFYLVSVRAGNEKPVMEKVIVR